MAKKKTVKRGRPKGSKNKPKPSTESKRRGRPSKKQVVKKKVTKRGRPPKKKVGRPRSEKKVVKQTGKRRGRPPKNQALNDIDLSNVKTFRFLGYCPNCHGMITSSDFEEGKKTIICCFSCGKRCRVGKLLESPQARNDDPKPKSKKEFLEATTSVHEYATEDYSQNTDVPNEFKDFLPSDDD